MEHQPLNFSLDIHTLCFEVMWRRRNLKLGSSNFSFLTKVSFFVKLSIAIGCFPPQHLGAHIIKPIVAI